MDSALPLKPHDDADVKPSFRKPSNEMATRKYRRHSPVDGSNSPSSGGSPMCERSPVYSPEDRDRAKTHSDRQRRDEKRILESNSGGNRSSKGSDSQRHSDRQTSNNSHESWRYDDHNRQKRPANEEDRGYHRSSRSERDFRSGTLSDYTRRDSNYERSRESWRNVGKYTRDRSDYVGHRSNDKARDSVIDHHKHNEKDSDRAAHGSKPGNSSRHDIKTGDRDRRRDREVHGERSDRHRSPGDQNNDESRGHLKELVVGRDSGTSDSKHAHETSNKELDGLRNDQLHKRKHTSKESDEQKKCPKELGTSESKSSTFHDKERRKELITENQNSSDKKLKLVQEEGEKPFSSSKQVEVAGKFTTQPSSSVTNQVNAAQNLDAAKVKAMQAAELVNKNLVGGGYMSTDQKKKLLWGSKKNTTTEESSKRWDLHSFADRERQEKFNKLMGVKGDGNLEEKPGEKDGSLHAEQQEQLKIDLEKQYTAGLRRRDGRTVGLGL